MKLKYTDPKKKRLQTIEIGLMLLFLPSGLYFGAQSFQDWRTYKKAEAMYQDGSLLTHQGNLPEAITKFEESLKVYPKSYGCWEALAVAHHLNDNAKSELSTYQRAVEVLPESGNLRRELANAYHNSGDHVKELEAAEIAVTLENSDEIFTGRILKRAQQEASGDISTDRVKVPLEDLEEHLGHDHSSHEGHDH